jgi:hypothetical protein
MAKRKSKITVLRYDSADYLKTEQDMEACLEEAPDDASYLAAALGTIATGEGGPNAFAGPAANPGLAPMTCIPSETIAGLSDGYHWIGESPWTSAARTNMTKSYGIPADAAMGGVQTMYPEFCKRMASTTIRRSGPTRSKMPMWSSTWWTIRLARRLPT